MNIACNRSGIKDNLENEPGPDEDDLVDAAFDALPGDLRAEQRLLGMLLARPDLHKRARLDEADFADPLHWRIYRMANGLWRMGRHAYAIAVAAELWHVTPLLKGGDKPTPIESLVFEQLCWTFSEYVLELERSADDVPTLH